MIGRSLLTASLCRRKGAMAGARQGCRHIFAATLCAAVSGVDSCRARQAMEIDDTNGAPGKFFTEQKMTNALHLQDGQDELQQQLTMCGCRLVATLSVGLVVAALASRHARSVEEARRAKERTDAIMLQTSVPTIKNIRRRKGSSRTNFNNAAEPCVEQQED